MSNIYIPVSNTFRLQAHYLNQNKPFKAWSSSAELPLFRFCLSKNTLHFQYKDRTFNIVREKIGGYCDKRHEAHKCAVWAKLKSVNDAVAGTHTYHWTLKGWYLVGLKLQQSMSVRPQGALRWGEMYFLRGFLCSKCNPNLTHSHPPLYPPIHVPHPTFLFIPAPRLAILFPNSQSKQIL